MINSKNYLVIGLPYLIVVCSLYHLTYYGLFGLNGLDLISASDIIKSAVYPLLLTFGASTIGVFIAHKAYNSLSKKKLDVDNESPGIGGIILKTVLLLVFNFIFVTVYCFIFNDMNYLVFALAIGNVVFGMLNSDKLVSNDIANYVNKDFLVAILIYLPLFSIATAIQDADKIISNKSYKYSTFLETTSINVGTGIDTLKFIGLSEQTFLFTDMKNQKVYFIKSDKIMLQFK